MRLASTRKIRTEVDPEQREKSTTAFRRNPGVLTIPRVGTEVITSIEDSQCSQNLATLALNLMRCGYLKESDSNMSLKNLVQTGFQRWMQEKIGDLKHYELNFETTPELDYCIGVFDNSEILEASDSYFNKTAGEAPMYCLITPSRAKIFTVGAALTEIEAKIPGLGKTAYYWLVTQGARALHMDSPWRAEEYAQMTWWYGEDNDDGYLEMLGEYHEGEDLEEVLATSVKPSQWKASFPDWVTSIERPLSEQDLEAIAKNEDGSLESKVAQALHALIADQNACIPTVNDFGCEIVYAPVHIAWQDGDYSLAVSDDRIEEINMHGGEGYSDILSLMPIPYKPMLFRKWLVEMELGFRQLKNIERLIDLVGVPY